MTVRYRSALALALAVVVAAILIGFAVGGTTHSAARAVVLAFGTLMLGLAGYVTFLAVRDRHPDEDWSVVAGYATLRSGTGASAIWFGLGGGAVAGWTLVGFAVGFPLWASLMRRRRGLTSGD